MPDERQTPALRTLLTFLVFFLLMCCATLVWTLSQSQRITDPPASWYIDGVFYDNIAFNLAAGDGFRVDLQAQPWRASYTAANESERLVGKYDWLMPVKGTGQTALRSPAYPYCLAASYRMFGHRYDLARILGCLFTSLGIASLLTFSKIRWGTLPAAIAAITLMLDYSVMQFAGMLAAEALAIGVFGLTFVLIIRAFETPSLMRWSLGGAAFGLLMLTRGIWSLGLLIMISVWIAVFLVTRFRPESRNRGLAYAALFLGVAMVVAAPWWIRNCLVTRQFQPFGTAGACGFVAAYCDESLNAHGQWQVDVFHQNQQLVQADYDLDSVELVRLETAIGRESMRKTNAWIFDNWNRIPELMAFRAISHWGFFNPTVPFIFQTMNLWLVVVGLIGCCVCTGKLRTVFIFVLILDSVLVMLTWEHFGRYAIPIRPVVHVGYGLAIAALIRSARRHVRRH